MEKSLNKKKLVLFDIDYTLHNVQVYRDLHFEKIAKRSGYMDIEKFIEKCYDIYFDLRKQSHLYEYHAFIERLIQEFELSLSKEEIEQIILDQEIMKKSVYAETLPVLEALYQHNVTLGLFSTGQQTLQRAKTRIFSHVLTEEQIHIYENKNMKLESVLQKYHEYKLYMVDDYLDILVEAKKYHPDITSIWIKRGRHAEKIGIPKVKPDYTLLSLDGIVKIVLT